MTLRNKNLFGLILVGGKSTRMRRDKAMLSFQGKPQFQIGYDLLSKYCQKVFLSIRNDQSKTSEYKNYPAIIDRSEFDSIGPLGGILSAFAENPQKAWLVLACDLPFVTEKTIETLLNNRNLSKAATAYLSVHDNLPEPLCAVYEPAIASEMQKFFQQGINCPRKVLINSSCHLLRQDDPKVLENVNSPEEFQNALDIFKSKK